MDWDPVHRRLFEFNAQRFRPSFAEVGWKRGLDEEYEHRRAEVAFVEMQRETIRAQATTAPSEPARFVEWFEDLRETGPGQGDPLFPWLARDATLEDMRWFVFQELTGEAGFGDLVAMAQLALPARAKLELARNYWDEMGRGHEGAMHGPMLDRLARELDVRALARHTQPVAEALALANLMVALAIHRRYAYQAIGALGVIELTAPDRAALVNAGLARLGVRGDARRYFAVHATLDVKHSATWNTEVLAPLVEQEPRAAVAMAEGALMRLAAGAQCFARYRRELWPPRQGSVARRPTAAMRSTSA